MVTVWSSAAFVAAYGHVSAAICRAGLQIPQNLGGLAVERRKRTGEAKRYGNGERSAGGADGLRRHKDEGDFHHPDDNEGGGKRSCRDGEHHGSKPDEDIFKRIGGDKASACRTQGFQDDGIVDAETLACGERAAENEGCGDER